MKAKHLKHEERLKCETPLKNGKACEGKSIVLIDGRQTCMRCLCQLFNLNTAEAKEFLDLLRQAARNELKLQQKNAVKRRREQVVKLTTKKPMRIKSGQTIEFRFYIN